MNTAEMGAHKQGRRRGRRQPRGRQVDPQVLNEVRAVLGDAPRRPDLLIEHLHRLHDHAGHLSTAVLTALAAEMKMAMAEVYEVASFYAHFDIVDGGQTPPPATTLRICDGVSCMLAGAEALIAETAEAAGSDVRVVRAPCIGACDQAPAAARGHHLVPRATVDRLLRAAPAADSAVPAAAPPQDLAAYRADGGYAVLTRCLAGALAAEDVLAALAESGLRGLGGAGFPTHRKWALVRGQAGEKVLAVNADEGEPGTFKDRFFLNQSPHRMLEGMLIGAWVVGAGDCYVYLRDEYPEIAEFLAGELAKLADSGLAAHTRVHLRRGAGAYICGEESAMIESIEGKRGLPRHRPPYVAEVGVFGRPTLVNNVETLYWVPEIIARGGAWFSAQGTPDHPGPRSYSVSGRVKKPGVIIAPAGSTVRDLIDRAGGMADGHEFHAYLPGGASGGILPAGLGDLPLDFGTLEDYGAFVGSHAVVVLSQRDSPRAVAANLMRFFRDESCGQCTPCREGTGWMM
ncbi:MAG: NAD(P)H-dependent oxidoreductase subunit E, partial [Thalassobaculaceae bacterium]